MYHNNHDGTFTDVAEKAGVTVGTWSTGATFGDYDGDGRLDLFVAGYARLDLANPPVSGSKTVGYATCQFRGVQVMCGPRGLKGGQDHLFHSNGDGTFTSPASLYEHDRAEARCAPELFRLIFTRTRADSSGLHQGSQRPVRIRGGS